MSNGLFWSAGTMSAIRSSPAGAAGGAGGGCSVQFDGKYDR